MIHAGLDGVRRNLDPGEPENENLYALSAKQISEKGIRRLPGNLLESLAELKADSVLCEGLGQAFIDEFCEIKMQEYDEVTRKISPDEFKRYVDFF